MAEMDASTSHCDLIAWQAAMALVEAVYRDTEDFPRREVFGLTAQIRRSAISIPSNLAEGAARNSRKELIHFVGICCGSSAELQTQLQIAVRLGYLSAEAGCIGETARVARLVTNLRKSLRPEVS